MLAKTITYALNAADDTRIANEILLFLKKGTPPESARAKKFVALAKQDHEPEKFLHGACYCLERINGLVDIEYARLFAKYVLSKKNKKIAAPFLTIGDYPTNHAWHVLAPWQKVNRNPATRRAVITVQKENIKNNREIASVLKSGEPTTNKKIMTLRKIAKTQKNPKLFLRQAARTELAAARWDRALLFLLQG